MLTEKMLFCTHVRRLANLKVNQGFVIKKQQGIGFSL